jgi:hypothetical protein
MLCQQIIHETFNNQKFLRRVPFSFNNFWNTKATKNATGIFSGG